MATKRGEKRVGVDPLHSIFLASNCETHVSGNMRHNKSQHNRYDVNWKMEYNFSVKLKSEKKRRNDFREGCTTRNFANRQFAGT